MKSNIALLVFFLCSMDIVTAQCDSSSDVKDVFTALKIDDDLPFLQTSPMYLKTDLDKESLTIIKDGISRRYYIRQLKENGRFVFDTLSLNDIERKELDSLAIKQLRKWTNSNVLPCRIGRDVKVYKKNSDPPGIKRTTYQIMEPIFLRNHTLAFIFYKREMPYNYSEFTLLIKTLNKWEVWNKVIIKIEN
jgi:hypothetical protein